jgi:hypothetical protein
MHRCTYLVQSGHGSESKKRNVGPFELKFLQLRQVFEPLAREVGRIVH